MDAQELRIGNYVYAQSGKLVVNRDSIYKVENVNVQSARKYEPIPLTEEWLLKFGFIDFEKESFSYYIENNGEIVFKKSGLDILCDYPIQYVHQIQNLYFALSGEELQLK